MKCTIPIKLLNWNDIINQCRSNKYGANNHKKREMSDISVFLYKIPRIKNYPVKITFKWHIKSKCSDLDNKSCKSILDAMQHAGILENDNINHISEITYIAIPDKKDYVEVEVIENDGNS